MENRFLPMSSPASQARSRRASAPRQARRQSYGQGWGLDCMPGALSVEDARLVRPQAVNDRVLVVLIENGGIDLGIPALADKLIEVLPGSSFVPDDLRLKLINFLRAKIKEFTDDLLESAELALNRYNAAQPGTYGVVTVLRNSTATHDELRDTLFKHTREGRFVDLMVLTHGSERSIAIEGGVSDDAIRRWRSQLGRPLAIRSVYMMNCNGSTLNQAWLDAGAKVASGSIDTNYLPEPANTFFWRAWSGGQSFEAAVTSAYRKTVNLMNDAVRGFVASLPIPGSGLLTSQIDFEKFDFVRSSAPMVQGQRSLTVSSDDLSFASTLSSGLATTVLPVRLLATLARPASRAFGDAAGAGRVRLSHAHSYHSPSTVVAPREGFSRMQNPAVAVVGGIAVADAAQIGLAAAGIVQSQVNATSGSFQLSYDKAQRLLTADARRRMPGAQQAKTAYSRKLMWIGSEGPAGIEFAKAQLIIEWEGNAYGEISTAVIRRNLHASSDWSRSSANLAISRLERIPLPGTDPRTWPLVFGYEGTFDPVGNGLFEFSGEFEINAFGGLRFVRHEVVSRSLIDAVIFEKPETYVAKGPDVMAPVPEIPADQLKFLNENLP